jgi:hypothetical protein
MKQERQAHQFKSNTVPINLLCNILINHAKIGKPTTARSHVNHIHLNTTNLAIENRRIKINITWKTTRWAQVQLTPDSGGGTADRCSQEGRGTQTLEGIFLYNGGGQVVSYQLQGVFHQMTSWDDSHT